MTEEMRKEFDEFYDSYDEAFVILQQGHSMGRVTVRYALLEAAALGISETGRANLHGKVTARVTYDRETHTYTVVDLR